VADKPTDRGRSTARGKPTDRGGKPTDRGRSANSGGASAAAAFDVLQSASRLGGYLIVAMVVPMEAGGDGGGAESDSLTRRQRALADIAGQSAAALAALSSGRVESQAIRQRKTESFPAPGDASPQPDVLPRVPRIKPATQIY
jgi:hypothetical protein